MTTDSRVPEILKPMLTRKFPDIVSSEIVHLSAYAQIRFLRLGEATLRSLREAGEERLAKETETVKLSA